MRLPKEIIVLLVLMAVMVIGVVWYVIDRRAKNRLPADAPQAAPVRP